MADSIPQLPSENLSLETSASENCKRPSGFRHKAILLSGAILLFASIGFGIWGYWLTHRPTVYEIACIYRADSDLPWREFVETVRFTVNSEPDLKDCRIKMTADRPQECLVELDSTTSVLFRWYQANSTTDQELIRNIRGRTRPLALLLPMSSMQAQLFLKSLRETPDPGEAPEPAILLTGASNEKIDGFDKAQAARVFRFLAPNSIQAESVANALVERYFVNRPNEPSLTPNKVKFLFFSVDGNAYAEEIDDLFDKYTQKAFKDRNLKIPEIEHGLPLRDPLDPRDARQKVIDATAEKIRAYANEGNWVFVLLPTRGAFDDVWSALEKSEESSRVIVISGDGFTSDFERPMNPLQGYKFHRPPVETLGYSHGRTNTHSTGSETPEKRQTDSGSGTQREAQEYRLVKAVLSAAKTHPKPTVADFSGALAETKLFRRSSNFHEWAFPEDQSNKKDLQCDFDKTTGCWLWTDSFQMAKSAPSPKFLVPQTQTKVP